MNCYKLLTNRLYTVTAIKAIPCTSYRSLQHKNKKKYADN